MKNNHNFIYALLFVGLFLLSITSCEKEEENPYAPTASFNVPDLASNVKTIIETVYQDSIVAWKYKMEFDNNRLLKTVSTYRSDISIILNSYNYDLDNYTADIINEKGEIEQIRTFTTPEEMYEWNGVLNYIKAKDKISTPSSSVDQTVEILINTAAQLNFIVTNTSDGRQYNMNYIFNNYQYLMRYEYNYSITEKQSGTIEYEYY